jgi:hypothetical protein
MADLDALTGQQLKASEKCHEAVTPLYRSAHCFTHAIPSLAKIANVAIIYELSAT